MKATSLTMGALCVAGIFSAAATAHTAGIKAIWIALAMIALAPMLGLELSVRRKQEPALAVAAPAVVASGAEAVESEQLAEVIHVDFRRGRAA
ncbi:hypothetical protein GCM10027030_08910 [Luteococcus sediminum]